MRYLFVAALIAVNATGALAQTETERRRAHLPFVRAATDCIARSIAANDAALGHAAAGRWGDATSLVFEICRTQLQGMIAAHDQIYGGGGMSFFSGPYVNDLPRALNARLQGDIQRRTARLAEQEQREREAAAQRAQAANAQREARLTAMRDGIKSYRECLSNEAATIVPYSNEGAETIATVSETKCRGEREKLLNLSQALFGTGGETRRVMDEIMSDARKQLVADVVTLRAAAEAARLTAPRREPQTTPAAPGRTF